MTRSGSFQTPARRFSKLPSPVRWLGLGVLPSGFQPAVRRVNVRTTTFHLARLSNSCAFLGASRPVHRGWRHVDSTSATRIFSFQRREPTSCVATEPPNFRRAFDESSVLRRTTRFWGCAVDFSVSVPRFFASASSMHTDHLTIRYQPNFEANSKGFALLSTGPHPITAVRRQRDMKSLSHGLARELSLHADPLVCDSLHSRSS
jgi:hypothetical protein